MDEAKVEVPVIEHGLMQEVGMAPKEGDTVVTSATADGPKDIVVNGPTDVPVNGPVDFFARIVPPHHNKSRPVTEADLPKVMEEGKVLYNLCYTRCGRYNGAHAVHHSQIDDKDPMNFFITADREIIINPTMTRHTKALVDSKEGCVTFFDNPEKIVGRFHKIEVDFQTITKEDKLSEVFHVELTGKASKIFQHEIGHGNAEYIYPIK